MQDMKKDQREIKRHLQQIKKEQRNINEEITKIKQENSYLKYKNKQIKEENRMIMDELKEVKKYRMDGKRKKRNNVILRGLNTNCIETSKMTIEFFLKEYLAI